MTTPEDPKEVPEDASLDAEYTDPYEGMEIGSYDPTEVTEVPLGTPLGTGEDTAEDDGPFDPKYKEDFEGLAYLGALEARFSYIGHKIVVRTMTTHELLAVSRIVKDYADTIGDSRAYATAMVAMSIVTVDGIGLPAPIEESDEDLDWAFQRFNYVKARWFPYVIDYVYERILLLENRVRDVLAEMEKQAKKA